MWFPKITICDRFSSLTSTAATRDKNNEIFYRISLDYSLYLHKNKSFFLSVNFLSETNLVLTYLTL